MDSLSPAHRIGAASGSSRTEWNSGTVARTGSTIVSSTSATAETGGLSVYTPDTGDVRRATCYVRSEVLTCYVQCGVLLVTPDILPAQ